MGLTSVSVNRIHIPLIADVAIIVISSTGIAVRLIISTDNSVPLSISTMKQIVSNIAACAIWSLRSVLTATRVVGVERIMPQFNRSFFLGFQNHSRQRPVYQTCMKKIIHILPQSCLGGIIVGGHLQTVSFPNIQTLVIPVCPRRILTMHRRICSEPNHVIVGILRSSPGEGIGKADRRNGTVGLRCGKIPDKTKAAIHNLTLCQVPASTPDILRVIGVIGSIADEGVVHWGIDIVGAFLNLILV